jgi:hypothetical protein
MSLSHFVWVVQSFRDFTEIYSAPKYSRHTNLGVKRSVVAEDVCVVVAVDEAVSVMVVRAVAVLVDAIVLVADEVAVVNTQSENTPFWNASRIAFPVETAKEQFVELVRKPERLQPNVMTGVDVKRV